VTPEKIIGRKSMEAQSANDATPEPNL